MLNDGDVLYSFSAIKKARSGKRATGHPRGRQLFSWIADLEQRSLFFLKKNPQKKKKKGEMDSKYQKKGKKRRKKKGKYRLVSVQLYVSINVCEFLL